MPRFSPILALLLIIPQSLSAPTPQLATIVDSIVRRYEGERITHRITITRTVWCTTSTEEATLIDALPATTPEPPTIPPWDNDVTDSPAISSPLDVGPTTVVYDSVPTSIPIGDPLPPVDVVPSAAATPDEIPQFTPSPKPQVTSTSALTVDTSRPPVVSPSEPAVTVVIPDEFTTQQPPTTVAIEPGIGTIINPISTSTSAADPFPTPDITSPSEALEPLPSTVIGSTSIAAAPQSSIVVNDIFRPMSTSDLPDNIQYAGKHPARPPLTSRRRATSGPIQTNKFYGNMMLEDQSQTVWTHPYSIWWNKGRGETKSWGLCVSHVEDKILQPENERQNGAPPRYYLNPLFVESLCLSAAELGEDTRLGVDASSAFAADFALQDSSNSEESKLNFALVQGMAFFTARYTNSKPLIQSGVLFTSFTGPAIVLNDTPSSTVVYKFTATLSDGRTWLIYISSEDANLDPTAFKLLDNTLVTGPEGFSGVIQVAKVPFNVEVTHSAPFDRSAGVYPIDGNISGSVDGSLGTYTISWRKGGITSKPLLTYALPHLIESMSPSTLSTRTSLRLVTTTKGTATAFSTDSFTMLEFTLPVDMGFTPWRPGNFTRPNIPESALELISEVAGIELAQDIDSQTNLPSMYFSGKALSKFASALVLLSTTGQNPHLALAALPQLKDAFAVFVDNDQDNALVYDATWGGIVSEAGYEDPGADFGNSWYNDHHFHYGYFVFAASVIGTLDPSWLLSNSGANKNWVDTLVRDFANPVSDDLFPQMRAFDFFHGHSWAKGLIPSADGKDQESSSEDVFSSYALKMWGLTTKDTALEARGNLLLAIQARALRNYYLMIPPTDADGVDQVDPNGVSADADTNVLANFNHPREFTRNAVAGILFENKADATTWFSPAPEAIHGIHMLPLSPASTLTRSPEFVASEWEAFFATGGAADVGGVEAVDDGWKGVLYANLAIVDARKSWAFLAGEGFQERWLDGGASRTGYLCWAAGLGGAS